MEQIARCVPTPPADVQSPRPTTNSSPPHHVPRPNPHAGNVGVVCFCVFFVCEFRSVFDLLHLHSNTLALDATATSGLRQFSRVGYLEFLEGSDSVKLHPPTQCFLGQSGRAEGVREERTPPTTPYHY